MGWQREVAEETIRGRGVIVAEYFDEGCSRRLPWRERAAAAQLMAAAEHPDRSFDAVVIGEYERAFYGDQFDAVLAAGGGTEARDPARVDADGGRCGAQPPDRGLDVMQLGGEGRLPREPVLDGGDREPLLQESRLQGAELKV